MKSAAISVIGSLAGGGGGRGAADRDTCEYSVLIVAPAIAVIAAHLRKRPAWEKGEPFKVPSELYQAASEEMRSIMKKRGFPLPVSKALKSNGVDNFLIFGTPIVSNG